MAKASRYRNVEPFYGSNVPFEGSRARRIGPATGVLEYTIQEGDRLDLLALNYYVDSRMWWRILDANPEVIFGANLSLDDSVGKTILIPRVSEGGAGV